MMNGSNYYDTSEKTTHMKNINTAVKVTTISLVAFVVLFGAVRLVSGALDKSEIGECQTWQSEAHAYDAHYFISHWQDEQCRAHGIVIDAEVK